MTNKTNAEIDKFPTDSDFVARIYLSGWNIHVLNYLGLPNALLDTDYTDFWWKT